MKRQFTPEENTEFRRRHAEIVDSLRNRGLQRYIVTTPDNIFYLTGATFEPLERPFFLTVTADGAREFVVPMLELDHMAKAWGIDGGRIRTYKEYPAPAGDSWQEVLLERNSTKGSFGFDAGTPWSVANVLSQEGGHAMELVENLRIVKSDWEVAQIERAARYADWGVQEILRRAWNGAFAAETYMPTQALQRKIIREVKDWDALATKVIAAAWPAPLSAEPHSVPHMGSLIGKGPHVAMVLTRVNGYAAESERTFFTSTPTASERKIFETLMQARAIAFKLIRPGVPCAEIDETVNDYMSAEGYGDFATRLHRTGHGFGLGNHEPPWIAEGSDHVLARNMVISIEPGIYIKGQGGYRHSDTVLVTETGYQLLTHAPLTLDQLTLNDTRLGHWLNHWLVAKALKIKRP